MEKQLTEMAKEIGESMGLERELSVKIKKFKEKIAYVSLDTGVISLNERIIDDEELVKKVLTHEIRHLKSGSKWHGPEFFEGKVDE